MVTMLIDNSCNNIFDEVDVLDKGYDKKNRAINWKILCRIKDVSVIPTSRLRYTQRDIDTNVIMATQQS